MLPVSYPGGSLKPPVKDRVSDKPRGGTFVRVPRGETRSTASSGPLVSHDKKEHPPVTKKEMIQAIAEELDIDQTLARKIVQRCLDSIVDTIVTCGRLELRNFGVFEVKQRAARKARNPKTNEEVYVPAKRVITFQAGKNVVARLRNASASD